MVPLIAGAACLYTFHGIRLFGTVGYGGSAMDSMGTNAYSSNRGADMPAVSWQAVSECMWDEGASPFDDYGGNGLMEGEWPVDEYGDQVPFDRSEHFFDKDYFFTLPVAATLTPMCAYSIESMALPPYPPLPYDMYGWTYLRWFLRPQDESAVWHGRINFEYRCAPDAESWLESNGETLIIGGAVYKADADFQAWIEDASAQGGKSWYDQSMLFGGEEGEAPSTIPTPPFAVSRLLLPTFPNGAAYDEELPEEATWQNEEFQYYQEHGTLPPVDPDAPTPPPWLAPGLDAKYPEDQNEEITDEMKEFWELKGYGKVSPWYTHPKRVYPDALSARKDSRGLLEQMAPFFDAASLGKVGFNVRVTGMTLNRWRKCGEKHMCANGLFPAFSDNTYTANMVCWATSTEPEYASLRTENGGAATYEMYKYPAPLSTSLWWYAEKGAHIPAQGRWVGNNLDAEWEFLHNQEDDTPEVEIVVEGAGPDIDWYVPNGDPNRIIVHTVDSLDPNQIGYPLPLNVIVVVTVTATRG